jgi:xylan 1,4-beta-xylosidase
VSTDAAALTPRTPRLPERPVIPGFHPDPTVCRVGEDYYLACSSFEYLPGVPIFRSRDLVTWEQIGSALERPAQVVPGAPASGGIYAPTLRHHDGTFWLVTTDVSRAGHLLVSATDPAGPWSDAVRIDAGGIDPDIAWDDDGTCYLTWTDGGTVQAVLDPATGSLLTEPQRLWSGTGGRDPEAPHLYRVGDTWYLLVAEGGTGLGHAVTVARGSAPSGPFEPCPDNPLLTARGTDSAVQNTGHADLVQRPDGTWAAVFLGVRPTGSFPGWHVLGRETFAAEIDWIDGWPHLGGPLQPDTTPPLEQELGDDLPLDWVGAGVLPGDVLRRGAGGWTLAGPDGAGPDGRDGEDAERVFVGRRQQHRVVTVRAELDASAGSGGLEVRIDPAHAVAVEVDGDAVRAVARVGSLVQVLGSAPLPAGGPVVVELRIAPSTAPEYSRERGPDVIVVGLVGPSEPEGTDGPGGWRELGHLDGRYLSTEVAGGFTGRMVGVTCASGTLGVRSLHYSGRD